MKLVVILSLLELTLRCDTFWQWVNRLRPPTISLPVVELVYVGNGYTLSVERGEAVGGRQVFLF